MALQCWFWFLVDICLGHKSTLESSRTVSLSGEQQIYNQNEKWFGAQNRNKFAVRACISRRKIKLLQHDER